MSDEQATLSLKLQSDQFNSGLSLARQRADELGVSTGRLSEKTLELTGSLKNATGAIASLYAGSKVIGFTQNLINAASAANDLDIKFHRVFQDVSFQADAMSKKLQTSFHRTTGTIQEMLVANGNIFTSMGMNQQAALGFSGQLSELSIKLGAFYGMSETAVSEAFSAAMMGQTRALRKLGISLEETAIKTEIARQRQQGITFASEQEAKAAATIALAYTQSANALNAYGTISNQYSEQSRRFAENLGEVKEVLGEAFLEPATKVLNAANKMIEGFNALDKSTTGTIAKVGAGVAAFGLLYGTIKIGYGLYKTFAAVNAAANVIAKEGTVAKGLETTATNTNAVAVVSGTMAINASAVAIATETAALTASTAALTANTAARSANATASVVSGVPASGVVSAGTKAATNAKTASNVATVANRVQAERSQAEKQYASAMSRRGKELTNIDTSIRNANLSRSLVDRAKNERDLQRPFLSSGPQSFRKAAQGKYIAAGELQSRAESQLAVQTTKLSAARKNLTIAENQGAAAAKAKAMADRKQALLNNLAANRTANASSGFSTFSRNADAGVANRLQEAAARESVRAEMAAANLRRRQQLYNISLEQKEAMKRLRQPGLHGWANRLEYRSRVSTFGRNGDAISGIAGRARNLAVGSVSNVARGASNLATGTISVGRSIGTAATFAAMNPGIVGSRMLSGAGRAGMGMTNAVLSVPFRSVGLIGKAFKGLSGGLTPLFTNLTRGIPLLGRFAPLIGGLLGPVGAIVGIGAGILGGLKLLKEAPMALEWCLDKIGKILTWENIKKAFSGIWSMGKNIASGMFDLIGGAANGVLELSGRAVFGAINTVFGTKYKTQTQVLYEQNKTLETQQAAMTKRREENAKREAVYLAARAAVAEAEEKWLDIQNQINTKRQSLVFENLDDEGKRDHYQRERRSLLGGVLDFEGRQTAMSEKYASLATAKAEAERAASQIGENDKSRKLFAEYLEQSKGLSLVKWADNRNVTNAELDNMNILSEAEKSKKAFGNFGSSYQRRMEKYGQEKLQILEMDQKIWQSEMDTIAKMPDVNERVRAYQKMHDHSQVSAIAMLGGQDRGILVDELEKHQAEVERLTKEYNDADQAGNDLLKTQRQEELDRAEKKRLEAKSALSELDGYVSRMRKIEEEEKKVQDEIHKAEKERIEEYQKRQNELFEFRYSTARSATERQKMSINRFDELYKRYGLTNNEEEKKRLKDDLKMEFERLKSQENSHQAEWSGVRNTTASAIEATSVQAREMENRKFNSMEKNIVENTGKTAKYTEMMQKILEESVRGSNSPITMSQS